MVPRRTKAAGDEAPGTRELIRAGIQRRPGTSKNALAQLLGLNWRTVDHHIRALSGRDEVHVDTGPWRHGVFDRSVPKNHRTLIAALHDEQDREIIATLTRVRAAGVPQLSEALGVSSKVVRRSASRLVDEGVLLDDKRPHPTFRLAKPELATRLLEETRR